MVEKPEEKPTPIEERIEAPLKGIQTSPCYFMWHNVVNNQITLQVFCPVSWVDLFNSYLLHSLSLATLNAWSFITNNKNVSANIFKYPKLRNLKKKKPYLSKWKNQKCFLLKKVIFWMPFIHVIVLVLLFFVKFLLICPLLYMCVFYQVLYFNS